MDLLIWVDGLDDTTKYACMITRIQDYINKYSPRIEVNCLFQHKEDGKTHNQGGQGGEAAKLGGAAACQPGEQST